MVQMFHHHTLWAIRQDMEALSSPAGRQEPRVHQIFADLYGTQALCVTCDRRSPLGKASEVTDSHR